jgi:DNA-binding NarL/FixJ family response regulator
LAKGNLTPEHVVRDELIERGRAAFARMAWSEAYADLAAADHDAPLEPPDLERLARAADLVARDAESDDAFARAHRAYLDRGEVERAARAAYWLGQKLLSRGEPARGGGWLGRAQHLLEDGRDCVEQGYLLLPQALRTFFEMGDPASANAIFRRAIAIGERFDDLDLTTMGRLGSGRTLVAMERVDEGIALLDEVMVAAVAGELSPVVVGIVYCAVIDACRDIHDIARAREWTAALSDWCAGQPDMVPFRGQCMVHRAEILQLRGAWSDAMAEAQRAVELLSRMTDPAPIGAAVYRQAELYRLRGELDRAEGAYREATRLGRDVQPGLALLRLAQGQHSAATAAIARALDETRDRTIRSRLLPAYVEIMLAAGQVEAARTALSELHEIAAALNTVYLRAVAAYAEGTVLLAEGQSREALSSLRTAWRTFQELEASYDAARARVAVAAACRALADEDGAAMELDAARWCFEQLGAAHDLAVLSGAAQPATVNGLTRREVEVIRLIAAGKTNRAIAAELSLSEKTVARHVSNIFTKLDLSSRSAATAYAYEHGLVSTPT